MEIFTSAVGTNDDIVFYIIAEGILTFIGFGYFARKINDNLLVYNKFYKGLCECTDRRYQNWKQSDGSCSNVQMLLLFIVYWIYLTFIFPVVIIWSMYVSKL